MATPWWYAAASAIGALGGSSLSPFAQAYRDSRTARREDRRRLEDARRDVYASAVGQLMEIREKISTVLFMFRFSVGLADAADEAAVRTQDQLLRQNWAEVEGLISNDLPRALGPVLERASDRVLASFNRMQMNSAFWPGTYDTFAEVAVDEGEFDTLLRGGASVEEALMQRQTRPMTRDEFLESQRSMGKHYLRDFESFIHLLRREAGLTRRRKADYFDPADHEAGWFRHPIRATRARVRSWRMRYWRWRNQHRDKTRATPEA